MNQITSVGIDVSKGFSMVAIRQPGGRDRRTTFSGKSYIPGVECAGSTSPHSSRRNPYSNGAHQLLLATHWIDAG